CQGCGGAQSNRARNCWSKIATSPSSAARMVAAVAAEEPDTVAVLVGEDAPPVDLLFGDPAIAVEPLPDPRWRQRRVFRQHEWSFYRAIQRLRCVWDQFSAAQRARSASASSGVTHRSNERLKIGQ